MRNLIDLSFDHSTAHLVTLCAFRRQNLLGYMEKGAVVLTKLGREVDESWHRLKTRWPEMTLDEYIIMPNHFHALFWISKGKSDSGLEIDIIMNAFVATFENSSDPVWQPGWQTRSIDRSPLLSAMRRYIKNNPSNWYRDPLNPATDISSCSIEWISSRRINR